MNIVILNGNPDKENTWFDRYIQGYQLKLHKTGHYIKSFQLRDMSIEVFGKAIEPTSPFQADNYSDDLRYIIDMLKETDLLVWASPLKQGLLPELIKIFQKRIYQHFKDHQEDASQWLRSHTLPKIPLIGVILQPESELVEGEILLNRLTQERMAAELHTVLSFLITSDLNLTDAACLTFKSFNYRQYLEETCNEFLGGPVPEMDSV